MESSNAPTLSISLLQFGQMGSMGHAALLQETAGEPNRTQDEQAAPRPESPDLFADISNKTMMLAMTHEMVSGQTFQKLLCFHETK